MKRITILFSLILIIGLAACSGAGSASQPIPTVALAPGASDSPASATSARGNAAASGFIVPAQQAQMAFTLAGTVQTVRVAEGENIRAGDILAELDSALLQIDLDQAKRRVRELTSTSAIAAAMQEIANNQKTVEDAQNKIDSLNRPRASQTRIDNIEAEIDLAKQALSRAQDTYRQVAKLADGDTRKAAAQLALTNAQLRLNTLYADYNWITGSPTATDAAIIQANYEAAKAAQQEAQWYLAALKGENLPAEATGRKLAELEQAKDAIKIAEKRIENARMVAPISGTVIAVNIIAGEYAVPGQVVFIIADLANLKVETTDLSERDIPSVAVGQQVSVFVEALGQTLNGQVTSISSTASTLGGDVVYRTTIELDSPPDGLKAGMSAEVRFETAP